MRKSSSETQRLAKISAISCSLESRLVSPEHNFSLSVALNDTDSNSGIKSSSHFEWDEWGGTSSTTRSTHHPHVAAIYSLLNKLFDFLLSHAHPSLSLSWRLEKSFIVISFNSREYIGNDPITEHSWEAEIEVLLLNQFRHRQPAVHCPEINSMWTICWPLCVSFVCMDKEKTLWAKLNFGLEPTSHVFASFFWAQNNWFLLAARRRVWAGESINFVILILLLLFSVCVSTYSTLIWNLRHKTVDFLVCCCVQISHKMQKDVSLVFSQSATFEHEWSWFRHSAKNIFCVWKEREGKNRITWGLFVRACTLNRAKILSICFLSAVKWKACFWPIVMKPFSWDSKLFCVYRLSVRGLREDVRHK